MPKERNKAIPAVYAILVKDHKVLLSRRANTGYEDGNYSLPSGHVEGDEKPIEALIRECVEEVGITLNSSDAKLVHTLYRSKNNDGPRVDLFFIADSWVGEPKNMEPDKCDDLSWFNLDQLPENTIPYISQVFQNIKEKLVYSEV